MTRLLFLSSVVDGGSPRSQRTLARALIDRGHAVEFLVDDQRRAPVSRRVGEQLADASVRFKDSQLLSAAAAIPGARARARSIEQLPHRTSPHPHNALGQMIEEFAPHVVVGNSVDRHSWRRALETCRERGIATVLYLREVSALRHLEITPRPADAIVANAQTLVAAAEAQGHDCAFVPSVIDTSATTTESSRTAALLINPVASHGVDLAIEVARRCPGIPFVFQESWPMEPMEWKALDQRVRSLGNVSLRRREEPGPQLYGTARVLLVPHRIDNRPRVIVEAQANAIPCIISHHRGLREAAGNEATTFHHDDIGAWTDALLRVWEDQAYYEEIVANTVRAANRPELDPDVVVDAFQKIVDDVSVRAATL